MCLSIIGCGKSHPPIEYKFERGEHITVKLSSEVGMVVDMQQLPFLETNRYYVRFYRDVESGVFTKKKNKKYVVKYFYGYEIEKTEQ